MKRINFYGVLISLVVLMTTFTAHAQATRTWVSGVGDDFNPCSRTAPCQTFQRAYSQTAVRGEINCIDPGSYGTLTIDHSISIVCRGVTAGVLPSAATNGFTIATTAATDRVVIDGLDFEGSGHGVIGIDMTGAGNLIIRNCSIRNFTSYGVDLAAASASPPPRMVIQNTLITGNIGGGINISGVSGAINYAEILNSVIDANSHAGIQITAPSQLVLSATTVINNPSSIIATGTGTVIDYGNNILRN